VTFVSATGGGANNSGVVNWSLGTLASGQVSNVTVTVTARPAAHDQHGQCEHADG